MRPVLFDIRMADGSRHVADVLMNIPPSAMRVRLAMVEGLHITAFVGSDVEAWIDFDCRGHSYSIHNPFNEYWLFARDPSSPDDELAAALRIVAGA